MATTIDWGTKVINVQQADLLQIQVTPIPIYEHNINDFRKDLADLLDDPTGIPYDDTHIHTAPVTLSGVTYARLLEIINGYTITYLPDTAWTVNITGGNSNVGDRKNPNNVSIQTANSGGLIESAVSGLTADEALTLVMILKVLRNRRETNPTTGKQTIYDDDSVAVLIEGDLYEDIAGTQTYQGQGADRADRLA